MVGVPSTPPQGTAAALAFLGRRQVQNTTAKGPLPMLSTPLSTVPTLGDDYTAGPAVAKPHQNKSKVRGLSLASILVKTAGFCQ